MKKIAILCAGTALCAALLAGCGSDMPAVPEQTTSTPAITTSSAGNGNTTPASSAPAASTPNTAGGNTAQTGIISAEEAQKIAIDTAKTVSSQNPSADYTVTKSKLDYDDGIQVYDIELVSNNIKFEYEINAATGAILEQKQEPVSTGNTGIATSISADEAVSIAKKAAGISGGTLVKNQLDYDDGRAVYEIEISENGVQHEFEIDANTGAILEQSRETY